MFLGFIASALATEEKQIDDIVRDLMDENVTTIVLTGKTGVGKTWMASEISKRGMQVGICEISGAMQVGTSKTIEAIKEGKLMTDNEISQLAKQVGICFGTIWVFSNPGDLRPGKSGDETGKSGDDTAFKDDEKEELEWILMKRISDKLNKMRSDKLKQLRFDMLQKVRFDMLQEVRYLLEKMRSDDELEKVGLDELEKMMVEKDERLSAVQLEKRKPDFEEMISKIKGSLSALLSEIPKKEREKMKSEISKKEKMKSEIPEKEKEKMKSEISEKEKEKEKIGNGI